MIAVIVASARNGVIGKDGKMPWKLPADLKRFKALTMGHVLLMGRKTYQSIGKPLPGRSTIVLSGGPNLTSPQPGTLRIQASDLESALGMYKVYRTIAEETSQKPADLFICGGESVYREAFVLGVVDKVYLTGIGADYEGDTHFPKLDEWCWVGGAFRFRKAQEERHETPDFPHPYWFFEYEKIPAPTMSQE